MSQTPRIKLTYVPENTLDPAAGLNVSLDELDALTQTAVTSMALTAPPGSPVNGEMYIPATAATGAWSGKAHYLARYVSDGAFWQFFTPGVQVNMLVNREDDRLYIYAGSSNGYWVVV